MGSTSIHWVGDHPFEPLHPTSAKKYACRERDGPPCQLSRGWQVLQQMWIWRIACRQESMQVINPPWLWNQGQTSPEVQNRGISGPTKEHIYVYLQKEKKEKKKEGICIERYRSYFVNNDSFFLAIPYHPVDTSVDTCNFLEIRKYCPKFYNGSLWEFFFSIYIVSKKNLLIVQTLWL